MIRRAVTVWFALMATESIHGVARAIWFVPLVGDLRARQIGVFTGSALNLIVTFLLIVWLHPPDRTAAMKIGALWLLGGLLPIGLVVLTVTPLLAAKLRRLF